MDFFSCALGRLKHELRVSKDGEVAEILGLSKTAFSERKKRNSFPEKELKDIALKRPELGIDVLYVLTGEREYSRQETQDQFIDRMQAIKATGQIVDALPLSSTEREGLRLCLTGDAQTDAATIAEAFTRQKPQITSYPKATVTPLPANEHAGLTWRELMILAVDELNAAGLHLPGEKLAEMGLKYV